MSELTELGTRIANVEWASDGELLVVTGRDGTVRLWVVELGESLGLVFNGTSIYGSRAWYDPFAETVWVTTSGRVRQIPVTPERWVDKACDFVGRGFTNEEWERLVPGNGPLQSGCT